MLSEAEIARRRPVWVALSELWLDTELDEADLHRIAEVLRASAYRLAELRRIYLHEVAPVMYPNTLSVAGEWAGVDPDWLVAEITKRMGDTSKARDRRWKLKQRVMTYASEDHWKRLVQLLS